MSSAQTSLELQFQADLQCDNVDSSSYCATLQIRIVEIGASANLGSSSILFSYNQLALEYASYTALGFDDTDNCILGLLPAWAEHGVDGDTPGLFNITLSLDAALEEGEQEFSCPTIGNDWIDISTICFNIIDPNLNSNLSFSSQPDLVSFNNYTPNDGTNQIGEGMFYGTMDALACMVFADPCESVVDMVYDTSSIAICSGDIINLQGLIGDPSTTDVTWTNEAGMPFTNPIQTSTTACEGSVEGYNAQYISTDINGCSITHNEYLIVQIYPEIEASFVADEQDCRVELQTCENFFVTWEMGGSSGNGNIVEVLEGEQGTVVFTVNNLGASGSCNHSNFQYTYNCAGIDPCLEPVVCGGSEVCTNALESFEICPQFCDLTSFTNLTGTTEFGSNVVVNGACLTYTPMPSLADGMQEKVRLNALDSTGACYLQTWTMTIGNCDPVETFTCVNDTLYECIGTGASIVLCPSFCKLPTSSQLSSITVLNNENITSIVDETCFRYTPLPTYEGTDKVEVVACNMISGEVICDTVIYKIDVTPACGESVAASIGVPDAFNIAANTTTLLAVLDNDALLSEHYICDIKQPDSGVILMHSNGNVYYIPTNGFTGNTSFTYILCDGSGMEEEVMVELNVVGDCGDFETCTRFMTMIEVCVEFCNPDMVLTETHTLFHCSIELLGDNCFSYLPLPGLTGLDELEAIGCNAAGDCETVNVLVDITEDCTDAGARLLNDFDKETACEIEASNVFTPNGDGINDIFDIDNLGYCYYDYQIKLFIFDRMGHIVYEHDSTVDDNKVLWDGRRGAQGKTVEAGVYYYQLQLTQEEDIVKEGGFIEVRH